MFFYFKKNYFNHKLTLTFKVLIIVFCLCSLNSVWGQDNIIYTTDTSLALQFKKRKDRQYIASEEIQKLKEGVLVVVLDNNTNKIKALNKLIKSDKITESQRILLQLRLDQTLADRTENHKEMRAAFKHYYNFSKVYFILSNDYERLINKEAGNYLMDVEGKSVAQEVLKFQHFFTFSNGLAYHKGDGMADYFVVKNEYKVQIPAPFPSVVRKTQLITAFGGFDELPSRGYRVKAKTIKKFNKRLHQFY